MTQIAVHKPMSNLQGRVEFTMHYDNPEMFGYDPDQPHWESESFSNLTSLLGLLSEGFIEQMRVAYGANKVTITHIYLDGDNDEGDAAAYWIGSEMKAWATATVNADHVEGKMTQCVEELERDLQRAVSTIQRFRT